MYIYNITLYIHDKYQCRTLGYKRSKKKKLTRNAPSLPPIIIIITTTIPLKPQTLIKRLLLLNHALERPVVVLRCASSSALACARASAPRIRRKTRFADEGV